MTDETPKNVIPDWLARCNAAHEEACRRITERRAAGKTALFDTLARAGITTVTVDFDGSGDSGQIEAIRATTGSGDVPLPKTNLEFVLPGRRDESPTDKYVHVKDVLEELVYDALEETHGSWGNDDGAYGEFTFDVARRTIALDYNERYTITDHYHHEF